MANGASAVTVGSRVQTRTSFWKINGLRMNVHYVEGVPLNVRKVVKERKVKRVRKQLMEPSKLTYQALEEFQRQRVERGDGPAISSLPNLLSALRAFVQQQNLTAASPVGSALRASFYKVLRQHTDTLECDGRSKEYIANRRILLGQWRSCVIAYDRACSIMYKQPHPFQIALQDIVAKGVTRKGLARSSGVPLATLKRWLEGALPNAASIKYVPRLEGMLGLHAGTLVDLIPGAAPASKKVAPESAPRIPYRERLALASKTPYLVKDPMPRLRQEWKDLLHHKVGGLAAPELLSDDTWDDCAGEIQRSRSSRWRTRAAVASELRPARWHATHEGRYCPTAAIQWGMVAQFTGWLMLDKAEGGQGMAADKAQTLANLARLTLVDAYVKWRVERAGGHAHTGITVFLKMVGALCNPRTGYLTQSGRLFASETDAGTDEAWRNRCTLAYKAARLSQDKLANRTSQSRNAKEPIQAALDLVNPLDAIADMVTRMTVAKPFTKGSREAIWARDRLFVKLLASNPLRIWNFRLMSYRADNTAHLRQDSHGAWFIYVPKHELKNENGAAKDRDYHMPVRQEVWCDIEEYLKHYRPMLMKSPSERVFIAERTGREFSETGMSRRFAALTKKYLHGCPGVGPQAMRHLVATSILKASPNDWTTAAWALHDREDTVRKNYAHLAVGDAARWLEKSQAGPFSRMR